MADAYLMPSKVYVGDRAKLVVPLSNGFAEDSRTTQLNFTASLTSQDIIIHRVLLERRPGGNSLTIEFSAYKPGRVELPALEIAGEPFTGLSVEINSILDSSEASMVLSGPELPPAIPGTSFLVYGTISLILLSLLLASWVLLWGRKRLRGWLEKWKKKRLLAAMRGVEKRLRKALVRDDAESSVRREILDTLSTEFRSFLALFTGENYRAMTAVEISLLDSGTGAAGGKHLGNFFKRCDTSRFNGGEIGSEAVIVLLDDVKKILAETA